MASSYTAPRTQKAAEYSLSIAEYSTPPEKIFMAFDQHNMV
jgi:hypothetical protein